jgi:acyl-CoA thioesterase-1
VDIFVLELGGNDALRGFDLGTTRQNLEDIIVKVKEEKPEVEIILAGMQAPPNMGSDYSDGFATIYSELARKYDLPFIPFLLDGVGGNPELNLEDRIHPNVEGQKIVANNVWKVLKPLLK